MTDEKNDLQRQHAVSKEGAEPVSVNGMVASGYEPVEKAFRRNFTSQAMWERHSVCTSMVK